MTTIYFVRHALPDLKDKTENRVLSKQGLIDREKVYHALKDYRIDLFYSSPYPRAIQTIEPLAKHFKRDITIMNDLRERSVGAWVDDFSDFSKKQWYDFNYKLLEGESLGEVQTRNIKVLNQLLTRNSGKVMVIGTHGAALSTIIGYYHSFTYDDFERIKNKMPWIVKMDFNENNEFVHWQDIDII